MIALADRPGPRPLCWRAPPTRNSCPTPRIKKH